MHVKIVLMGNAQTDLHCNSEAYWEFSHLPRIGETVKNSVMSSQLNGIDGYLLSRGITDLQDVQWVVKNIVYGMVGSEIVPVIYFELNR